MEIRLFPVQRNPRLSIDEFGLRRTELGQSGGRTFRGIDGDIDVLKDLARSDPTGSVRRQDEVIPFLAGVFPADAVDESERFLELLGADQKASAIGCPFTVHTSHWAAILRGRKGLECWGQFTFTRLANRSQFVEPAEVLVDKLPG